MLAVVTMLVELVPRFVGSNREVSRLAGIRGEQTDFGNSGRVRGVFALSSIIALALSDCPSGAILARF